MVTILHVIIPYSSHPLLLTEHAANGLGAVDVNIENDIFSAVYVFKLINL